MKKRKHLRMSGAVCTITITFNTLMPMIGKRQLNSQNLMNLAKVLNQISNSTGSNYYNKERQMLIHTSLLNVELVFGLLM